MVPFGRIPLLLDLSEDAIGLVVDAVRALGHFPVALDLLLPAHIARLKHKHTDQRRRGSSRNRGPYPSDAPALGIVTIIAHAAYQSVVEVMSVHHRRNRRAIGVVCSEDLRRLIEELGHFVAQVVSS